MRDKTSKVAVLSVFEHRSFDLAGLLIIFTPQSDLAILNYIARYIIATMRVNRDFVDKHMAFRKCGTCADREPAASAGADAARAGILSGDAQNTNRSPRFSASKGRSATPLRSSCSIRFSQPGFMCVTNNAIEFGNDAMSSSSERGE